MRLTDEQLRESYGEHRDEPHVDQRLRDRHELLGQGVNIDDGPDAVACDWCGEGCPEDEAVCLESGSGPGHEQCAAAQVRRQVDEVIGQWAHDSLETLLTIVRDGSPDELLDFAARVRKQGTD